MSTCSGSTNGSSCQPSALQDQLNETRESRKFLGGIYTLLTALIGASASQTIYAFLTDKFATLTAAVNALQGGTLQAVSNVHTNSTGTVLGTGLRSVTFHNVGSNDDVTVNGAVLKRDVAISFSVDRPGDSLLSIPWTASGATTSVRIDYTKEV